MRGLEAGINKHTTAKLAIKTENSKLSLEIKKRKKQSVCLPRDKDILEALTTLKFMVIRDSPWHESSNLQTLPGEIGHLRHLRRLDLSSNKLAELPVEMGALQQLKDLDLSHNQLIALPAEIGQLIKLKNLELDHNHLATLPAEMGQLQQLRSLALEHNWLATLPAVIVQLHQLEWLGLSHNRLASLPEGRIYNPSATTSKQKRCP